MSSLKPKKFNEATKCLKPPTQWDEKKDGKCGNLWVFNDGKQSISCWKLSFWQRIKVLFFGRIWLSVFSGMSQPPVWLSCFKTVFEKKS